MTIKTRTELPPLYVREGHMGANDDIDQSKKIKHLTAFAWMIYTSATILGGVEDGLDKAKLSKAAKNAIEVSIDSYVVLANAGIKFMTDYVNAVKTGKWDSVEIPLPPVIDPKHDLLHDILNSIKGAINTAIVEFQDAPHAEELAHALTALETGLDGVMTTIGKYYPDLFDPSTDK